MFRPKGLIVAMVMVCFVFMAFNSNPVMADDAVELDILKKVKKTKRVADRLENILESQVLPRLGSVPKTGQTTCYDTVGTVIDCAGTGQDGEFQMRTPWPNPRFTDNGDGTVTDNMTGLIWLKYANCFETRTWATALTDCNTLNSGECGLTDGSNEGDWRLPNRKELESLLHLGFFSPALPDTAGTGKWSEGDPFTDVQSNFYWSATTFAFNTGSAWVVGMNSGYVHDAGSKAGSFYVWPVCAGQ